MAVIRRMKFPYRKLGSVKIKYLTCSPCKSSNGLYLWMPLYEMWETKPSLGTQHSSGYFSWVGTGNLTFTGEGDITYEQMEELCEKAFHKIINDTKPWNPDDCIVEVSDEYEEEEKEMLNEKEVKITQVNDFAKFVGFRIKGLSDGILVGPTPGKENCISIGYKGDTVIVPFNASTEDLKKINGED